jgi:phosphohistidine phosphatase
MDPMTAAGRSGAASRTRRLVVMRHAKAEASASSDHARDLTDRGRRQSRDVGARMADSGVVPELVLVSSAVRARSTCREVLAGMGTGVEVDVQVLDSLYDADADDVLASCATAVPAETVTVLVIGHNPTIAETAELLQPEHDRVELSFPTAAYAAFSVEGAWADLTPGIATLLDSYAPQV